MLVWNNNNLFLTTIISSIKNQLNENSPDSYLFVLTFALGISKFWLKDEDHWKGPVAAPCLGKGGIETHFQLWFSYSIQHVEVGIARPPLQRMPARCGMCRKLCCLSREGPDSVWRWWQGCATAWSLRHLGTGCTPGEYARKLLQGWVSLLFTTLANFQPVSVCFSANYNIFWGRLWKAAVHLVAVR